MAAALYGMFGDDLKDQFEKMSEYDKTNYLVLPLGETEDGKAIYARLPHDEMGQIYSALFWKIATAAQNNESLSNLLTDVFGFVIGRGPGVTPAIGTTVNWLQFWQAKNPYDSYRGRNIIDDTTFTAGGWASTKKMIEWTSNNYGLTSFSTYDPAKNTTFETTMQMLPGINRIFKVSDYGLTEKQDRIQQKSDQQRARELLQEKDIIGNYALKYRKDKAKFYFEGEAENAIKDILGHEPETEDEENRADNVRKKFNKEIIKIAGSSMFKSVAYATQNREKVQILSGYKDKMDEQSFADMLNEMLADKLISQAVYDEIM